MIAKIIASMVTSVPSIVIVLALGRFYGGVQLPAWTRSLTIDAYAENLGMGVGQGEVKIPVLCPNGRCHW